MVNDHSVRENTHYRHYMDYSSSLGFLYADMIGHATTFVTPVVEHWQEREMAQWIHHEQTLYHVAYNNR